jgi:hypothetical protein
MARPVLAPPGLCRAPLCRQRIGASERLASIRSAAAAHVLQATRPVLQQQIFLRRSAGRTFLTPALPTIASTVVFSTP